VHGSVMARVVIRRAVVCVFLVGVFFFVGLWLGLCVFLCRSMLGLCYCFLCSNCEVEPRHIVVVLLNRGCWVISLSVVSGCGFVSYRGACLPWVLLLPSGRTRFLGIGVGGCVAALVVRDRVRCCFVVCLCVSSCCALPGVLWLW